MDQFYSWKEVFNIGVEEIDRQHRAFLDCLNDCHRHASGESGAGFDIGAFAKIRVYAATHFRFEEEAMVKWGYPGLERQRQQHRYFEAQIRELESAHAGGGDRNAASLLVFLRDWLLNHILEEDKQFVPYVT